jgi:hypothetical protein
MSSLLCHANGSGCLRVPSCGVVQVGETAVPAGLRRHAAAPVQHLHEAWQGGENLLLRAPPWREVLPTAWPAAMLSSATRLPSPGAQNPSCFTLGPDGEMIHTCCACAGARYPAGPHSRPQERGVHHLGAREEGPGRLVLLRGEAFCPNIRASHAHVTSSDGHLLRHSSTSTSRQEQQQQLQLRTVSMAPHHPVVY